MDNPNPIYYRDLITPDNAITDLIKQLQELISQYDAAKVKIQGAAAEMAQGMKNVSAATEDQREQIKLSFEQSDKLVKSYRDVTTAQWQVTQAFIEQSKAKKEGEKIDKLIVQINTSMEGSYNRLSAQYRLNKIRLNEMSEAQRSGTEAGRKLESETKAIYEQMNKLQLATGKAQLQVGHYERGLLSVVGVNGKFADAILNSSKASETFSGIMGAVKSPLGAIVGIAGAAVSTFKLFRESVNSTQSSSDNLAFAMAELHGIWDRFAKSVASLDFRGFIRGAAESAAAGKNLAMVLDEVFERTNSVNLLKSALSAENAALEESAKNTALSYEERLAAAEKYIANVEPIYQQEEETARRVRDAELDNLFSLTNTRKFKSEEEKKAAEEEFAANIKNYNLNEETLQQAQKIIDAENKRAVAIREMGKAGGQIYVSVVEAQDKIIKSADDGVKAAADFLRQYNLTSDAEVKAYVDAQVAYNNAQAALYNENKRFITLKNNIEAQQTKEIETQNAARLKAAQDAAKEQAKLAEEKTKADAKAAEEAEKAAQEQINAQNALLQAQLQSIQLQISITEEGTQEMLQLRLDAINKQREIELAANNQKAEELRQSELAINAKYDNQVLKQSADFYTKLAEREFSAQQDLDAANFALLQTTEEEKTRFRLQQEKDRLQKILELNETAAQKLNDTEISAIKSTIAGIDKEMGKAGRGKKDAFDLIGLGGLDDDQKAAIDTTVRQTLNNVGQIIDAWKQAAEARVAAAQTSVDAAQEELDAEIEARNNGYANNVEDAQKNLDLKKKELEEAQKEKERATKAQVALDTITQTASLITASANIWSSLSAIPVVGPALAVAALATMWGSFAVAKVKAAQVASSGTESYGEGTVELLEGGSHASGHDIDMGTKKDGTRRRAEGGEFFAVINKRNSRRYRDVIPDVINAFNDGTFAEKYERANGSMSGIAVSLMANGGTDVSKLESDVRAIRTQGAESRYVDGSGNTVIRYKNLTRIVKNS